MIKLEKLNKNRSNDQQWPWSNIISIVILTTGGGGGGGTEPRNIQLQALHCWLAGCTDWLTGAAGE